MIYECTVCGYVYDESVEKIAWDDLAEDWVCPICDSGKSYFEVIAGSEGEDVEIDDDEVIKVSDPDESSLAYPSSYVKRGDSVEEYMDIIHEMSVSGKSIIEPMRSRRKIIGWDEILILGAQLNTFALMEDEDVKTTTIIGKHAEKPMVIENPVFITHMSFGALSRELKMSLAKGSAQAKTAMCSGEGGILPDVMEAAYKYIFEYVPNKYSVTETNLRNADAIEIKIGQGTKPGMGGHLPGEKVTGEIAMIRNKPVHEDIISPSRFEEIKDKEDLKTLVDDLRELSQGRPIGIKIAAGHIEKDLELIAYARPDFVTIDGRGGGTGASPKLIKDSTTIPTIFALYRARKYLDEHGLDMDLIITGGLRVSSDFAKALAMGADAIAIGTAAMMSAACQQYKVCHQGKCPVGCATQDQNLRKRLNGNNSALRIFNYLTASLEEIKTFARITGKHDIHDLSMEDLCTTHSEISGHTDIAHV